MADSDLIKLYSGRILELAANMTRTERLDAPDATVQKRAPLCGSTVTVDVKLDGERVTDFAQDVKACALGQAAASVVGREIVGLQKSEVILARDELSAMLRNNGPAPSAPFDDLSVLMAARDFSNRHASILLALEAVVEAISQTQDTVCA